MLILGIDPGTQILGYSLLDTEGGQLNILAMDVLYLKRLPDFNQRIRRIFDSTVRIIDSFHPDHLAIEAPFFGKNVQSMLKLGRAQGVAIAAAMSRDLSYTEYEPSVIKQLVTGNGNASKEQVASMLRSILGFSDSPKYLDATDALAVAYTCHMQFSNPLADLRRELMPKKQKHKPAKKQWSEFVSQNPDRLQ
ncbi:MAG: crossover junction endodeoxyribonuclease RuvC [Bacteroidales bacterium]|jgi:crossover junction endodeoxyribonuclease RuvC|nr:crossover junction endodeoxyribonuclease RuvC [Bacteroidales bacterium]